MTPFKCECVNKKKDFSFHFPIEMNQLFHLQIILPFSAVLHSRSVRIVISISQFELMNRKRHSDKFDANRN